MSGQEGAFSFCFVETKKFASSKLFRWGGVPGGRYLPCVERATLGRKLTLGKTDGAEGWRKSGAGEQKVVSFHPSRFIGWAMN